MDIDLLLPLGIFMVILATPIALFTSLDFGTSKRTAGRDRSRDAERVRGSVKPHTHAL